MRPVLNKVFTDSTYIVAVKTSGNVNATRPSTSCASSPRTGRI